LAIYINGVAQELLRLCANRNRALSHAGDRDRAGKGGETVRFADPDELEPTEKVYRKIARTD